MSAAPPTPTAEEVSPMRDAAHAVRLAVRWRAPLLTAGATVLLGAVGVGGWQVRNAQKIAQVDALGAKLAEHTAEHDRRIVAVEQVQAVLITERRALEERERARDERDKKRDEKLDKLLEGFARLEGRFEGRSHYQEDNDGRERRDVARDGPPVPRGNRR